MQNTFYISDNDRSLLFDFLIDNAIEIIPDMAYETAEYSIITEKSEFIRIMNDITIAFFLRHHSFKIQPLDCSLNEYNGKYYISHRTGGPLMETSFYRGYADDANIKAKATYLHHYASYVPIDYQTNLNDDGTFYYFQAPTELKQTYNVIVKFLKGCCKHIQYGTKKYRVSKEYLDCKELREEYKGVMS